MADIRPDVQNRVQLRPVTDAKFQVQDFGKDQIGRGLQAFGQGLSKVADDVQAIEDVHNEAAVKEVDNQATAAELEALRELEMAKGKDALLAYETFSSRMENIRKEAVSKLNNDRQKRMFGDVFERRAVGNNDRAQRYANKATLDYNIASTSGQIDTHIARAADVYDEADPAEFDASVLTIVNATKQLGVLKGNDADMTKADVEKFVGSAYAGVFERIRVEDPIKAKGFLDQHAGKIPGDVESELRRKVQPAFEEMRAEQIVDQVLSGAAAAGMDSRVEDVDARPEVQPDPKRRDENLAINANPLRGRDYKVVKGGEYGASRDGGTRNHGGLDYAAPEGTPVYPRVRAKVTEIDTVGKTDAGYYVKFQNADGTTGSYSHLRNVNVKVGQVIDIDTVVGSVGRTGKGGKPQYGAHLHEVIRDAKGNAIDPRKYKPGAVVEDKAEPGYTPKYDGNPVDIKAGYAGIEKMYRDGEISLSLRKQAQQALNQRAQYEDQIRDREYDAVQESITSVMADIIKNGGDILDPDRQLPGFTDASPAFQLQIRNQAASNKAAIASAQAAAAERANKARIEGNYGSYLTLLDDAIRRPELFMMHDIDAERGNFPKKEWERLKKIHKELRANGGYRPALSPELSKANSLASSVFAQAGINPKNTSNPNSLDAQKKAYLTNAILEKIDELQQDKGRKLTGQEERDEVLKPLLRTVTVEREGRFWGTNTEDMPWYQANMDGSAVNAVVKIKN